jgi:hypothetical protein
MPKKRAEQPPNPDSTSKNYEEKDSEQWKLRQKAQHGGLTKVSQVY